MSHRILLKFAAVFLGLLLPAMGQTGATKVGPRVKFICVSSLAENQQIILASRDEKGAWQELGTVKLRSSMITDWLPALDGELHLAVRKDNTLKSIGHFSYPAAARCALVALIAGPEKKAFETHVFDPAHIGFDKGSLLISNSNPQAAVVSLGTNTQTVGAGKEMVLKPALEGSGMYRLMVSYVDGSGKSVPCYDRQVSGNPDSRDMLFLLPDKALGMRVFSLPLFSSID